MTYFKAAACAAALTLMFLTPGAFLEASAEDCGTTYNGAIANPCPYPGPFSQTPAPTETPIADREPAPLVIDEVSTAAVLAHTGSTSSALGYVGVGLLGAGAWLLGVRRRVE